MASVGTGVNGPEIETVFNYTETPAVSNPNAFFYGPIWSSTAVGDIKTNEWQDPLPSQKPPVCYWG